METEAYLQMYEIEEKLWWYRGRRKVCFDLLRRYLRPGADRRILDVGCGTGYNLAPLREFGDAEGVDMSSEALHFCRRRGEERVTLHTAERLPFEDESFDLLTAFDVLEHIEDDRKSLDEFQRLLRPRGRLLIYTPALPWMYNDHDRRVHHKRRYLRKELREKVEGAGFVLEHLSYVNLFILPIVLAGRLYYRLRRIDHPEMELPPPYLNRIFTQLCFLESRIVNSVTLPYGMSLVALARKGQG